MLDLDLDKEILSIPREFRGDQNLIYSRVVVVPIVDTDSVGISSDINNKIILITIKKKTYRAKEFKQKLIKQDYRVEVYPNEEGIYRTSLASYYQ